MEKSENKERDIQKLCAIKTASRSVVGESSAVQFTSTSDADQRRPPSVLVFCDMDPKISYLIILVLFGMIFSSRCYGQNIYNVLDFGATGNGTNDDSQAVLMAWKKACGSTSGTSVMKFQAGIKYHLKPIEVRLKDWVLSKVGLTQEWMSWAFAKMDGYVVAPSNISEWEGYERGSWLHFLNVNGLIVTGNGIFDGYGDIWWNIAKHGGGVQAPAGLGFHHCNNLKLNGFASKNSPNKHITIQGCIGVTISNVHILAPKTSPNTDGIMISYSSQLNIHDCFIATGSVGSLGVGTTPSTVEHVHVKNCTFKGTLNGARIKTWNSGVGYARNITFEHITLLNSENPIIIDQDYAYLEGSSIKISDITYRGFVGTSLSEEAITLDCAKLGCSGIVMESVNLISALPGKNVTSFCKNADGIVISTYPNVPCLNKE
ncbi:hypothetical protein F8388_017871 [Cannabis sativa]|uniref:Polygalacturonase n=1 Tax=Cannabis sativa TaxID=3483 RepID=A0A7J6F3S1_CANSA|nr:hypothetical protein F8388_017871 [Cannabis sativa]